MQVLYVWCHAGVVSFHVGGRGGWVTERWEGVVTFVSHRHVDWGWGYLRGGGGGVVATAQASSRPNNAKFLGHRLSPLYDHGVTLHASLPRAHVPPPPSLPGSHPGPFAWLCWLLVRFPCAGLVVW